MDRRSLFLLMMLFFLGCDKGYYLISKGSDNVASDIIEFVYDEFDMYISLLSIDDYQFVGSVEIHARDYVYVNINGVIVEFMGHTINYTIRTNQERNPSETIRLSPGERRRIMYDWTQRSNWESLSGVEAGKQFLFYGPDIVHTNSGVYSIDSLFFVVGYEMTK